MPKLTGRTLDRLEDCLKAYAQEERLENASAFDCSKCKAKTVATKTLRIQRFPKCLIVHIKRFKLSTNSQLSAQERWIKYGGNVSFPLQGLNLGMFASKSSGVDPLDVVYDLYGVINHTGTRDVGHYTAICKVQGKGDEQLWYKFDDEKVTRVRFCGCRVVCSILQLKCSCVTSQTRVDHSIA
jgi:ubiquitin C-terminal hydrolase